MTAGVDSGGKRHVKLHYIVNATSRFKFYPHTRVDHDEDRRQNIAKIASEAITSINGKNPVGLTNPLLNPQTECRHEHLGI